MNKNIIKLGQALGTQYTIINNEWVMCSCPFSFWTHPDGDDKNYSFGISNNGGFNCFACGQKGHIMQLPRMLARYTHKPPYKLERIIKEILENKNTIDERLEIYKSKEEKSVKQYIDPRVLNSFENPTCRIFNMTVKDMEKWTIKKNKDRLMFPIFDHKKRIVAIKARIIGAKKMYFYDTAIKPKQEGIWYGDHLYYNTKKVAVVEGERDAILLSRFIPALCAMGTVNKEQINALKRYKQVLLFFDNDSAGHRNTELILSALYSKVKLYCVSDYKGCKDPAELVEKDLIKEALKTIIKL